MIARQTIGQCSVSGDAVLQTSYADDSIVRGYGFVISKNLTIGIGASEYVLFNYTTHTNGKYNKIYVLPPQFMASAGLVKVNVYRGTDYAGGTQIHAYNANQDDVKTESATTLTYGATGTTKGTLALEFMVGTDSQGNNLGGGTTQDLSFYVRNNTGKTLVEIVNESGAEITFHYGQVLYEI